MPSHLNSLVELPRTRITGAKKNKSGCDTREFEFLPFLGKKGGRSQTLS
jgi:hypothetical protein